MKHAKRLPVLLLALVLVLAIGTVRADAADDLYWSLAPDGTLTISGSGEMDSYEFFGASPWSGSELVRRVVIGEGVTSIGDRAFMNCPNLTTVELPASLRSIGSYAFQRCWALTEIDLPAGFTTIGESAFSGCHSLANVSLPASLTTIDRTAFYDCSSLTGIQLPAGLTELGGYAFLNCSSLERITVSGDNPHYANDENGVLFSKDMTALVAAPGALETYAVPAGVTHILDTAFAGCRSLTDIVFPDGLESIGDYAFHYCEGLTQIVFPAGLAEIGDVAFEFCTGLASVEFADGAATVGNYAFQNCGSLTEITFRGDAPALSDSAFEDITATAYYPLDRITWTYDVRWGYGGSITWVPYGQVAEVASGWTGLCRWSLTSNGVLTISGSGNMRNYDYEGNQPWAEWEPWIKAVVVEEGVTAIGSGAFLGLAQVRSVTLPETGLARIGEAAFYNCYRLQEITIPDSVYTVADYTFKNCAYLRSVRLPRELVKIGQGAFENCGSLTYIFVPGETKIIGAWSFKGCTALREADMQWADATEIRAGAFKNCTYLTEIVLPGNIQVLGDSCFYGIGAESFTVPATVTEIGPWCFARAADLRRITFRGDAPAIGEGAFNQITLTAWYPDGNPTWTAAVMGSYGGWVNWQAD